MTYTPSNYTTLANVERILRTANNKISIGDETNDQMSKTDADFFIKDASMFIDSILRKFTVDTALPLASPAIYPEISFAAPRLAAYFIYSSMFENMENLPPGIKGWFDEAKDSVHVFIDNLNNNVYPTLSPSTTGPGWETAEEMFQAKIGVAAVNAQVPNTTNRVPITDDNIGPYTDS